MFLKILKQLLNVNEEPEAIEENRIQENPPEGYELFDENIHEPQGQSCYLRNNLNDSVMFDESIHNRADIVWIEKE